MKKKTKILSLIIAFMLSVGLIPSTVFQASATKAKEIYDIFIWEDVFFHEYTIGEHFDLDAHIENYTDDLYIYYDEDTVDTYRFENGILTNGTNSYSYTVVSCPDVLEENISKVVLNIIDGSDDGYNFILNIYAGDDSEYEDEPNYNVTAIEITQAPYCQSFAQNWENSSPEFFKGLEMTFYLDNGTTYEYSYENDGIYPNIGDSTINVLENISELPLGKNTITYEYCGCYATLDIIVIEDPFITNPIVKAEMTALPTKVFNEPLYTCTTEEFQNTGIEQDKAETYINNSIALNMDGAEITIHRQDGTAIALPFIYEDQDGYIHIAYYWHRDMGYVLKVTDLGNFNARVDIFSINDDYYYGEAKPLCTTEFTVNHSIVQPSDPVPTPAYTTVLTDSETNITVKGNFDSETSLNVEKTTVQLDGAKTAYNITLTKNGTEIQPDSEITVSIPYSENGCKVYWVKADGTTEDMNATYTDGCYVFTTTHLSTYAVVATTNSENNSDKKPTTVDTSTVDTATKDTVNKGTNNNGTVQTGNPVTALAVLMLVALASGIVFIYFNKKNKI